MNRVVEPELLDELSANDPRAVESRRDLRRINGLMGNARILHRFVKRHVGAREVTIAEIGCGDGNVAREIARRLNGNVKLVLVDQAPVAADVMEADVFEWLESSPKVDVIIANLFLHHFSEEEVREMLRLVARACDCFAACEPRRSGFAEWFSRRLNLIGCNAVTQNDAVISVRAGFREKEISELWPRDGGWNLTERPEGWFSHFFGAVRR